MRVRPLAFICRDERDTAVTIHNLHKWINPDTYWFLTEGIQKKNVEALRRGFDSIFP